MENNKWSLSSSNDKREDQDPENIIIVPPFFHINSCTMENNYNNVLPSLMVEEIHNMDLSGVDPTPTKIYDELNQMLREAWYDEHRGATENALAGPLNRTP
jgi:hypothetical protein